MSASTLTIADFSPARGWFLPGTRGTIEAMNRSHVLFALSLSLATSSVSALEDAVPGPDTTGETSAEAKSAEAKSAEAKSAEASEPPAPAVAEGPSSADPLQADASPAPEARATPKAASAPAPPKRLPGAGSPALPLIARGDAQFIARDFDSACASYRSATGADSKSAAAYLRLADCSVALGNLDEAVQVAEQAARVVEPGTRLQLIILSRQAVVFEARTDLDKALASYASLTSTAASARDPGDRALFERIARERSLVIEARKKELAASALVKARIDEELAEATPKGLSATP